MVQHGGPGPWQTDDDQRFPYGSLLNVGTALQLVLDPQPVAEQSEALLADGKAAEQMQFGRALIGVQQAPECLPKRFIPPIRQAGASLRRGHERGV
jgi:hypothetical protein